MNITKVVATIAILAASTFVFIRINDNVQLQHKEAEKKAMKEAEEKAKKEAEEKAKKEAEEIQEKAKKERRELNEQLYEAAKRGDIDEITRLESLGADLNYQNEVVIIV